MNHRANLPWASLTIAAVIFAALGIGVTALLRSDLRGERGSGLPDSFTYDLEQYQKTDPALIGYHEVRRIAVALQEPRAVAMGLEDRIYVAGDRAIQAFAPDGKRLQDIALADEPRCLAIAGRHQASPGRIYVGLRTHVEVRDGEGNREAAWDSPGENSLLTSIAVGESEVYVADAGGRIVWRYSPAGKLLGRIGARDDARSIPGFTIPSPYFDVAVGPDGLLWAVNPAGHRLEAYTSEGDLEHHWGKSSVGIEGFCGCCNPANFAILPDGSFVTAEKGIPRVKIYDEGGQFVCVVAGPEQLLPTATLAVETRAPFRLKVIDVAADSRGRVLVLDPMTQSVRVFEKVAPNTRR